MDLQALFYTLASIAMIIFIVVMVTALWTLFYIRRQVSKLQDAVISRIASYTRPVDVFRGVTSSVIQNFLLKLRNNFNL